MTRSKTTKQKAKAKLTEFDWRMVFTLRCQAKRGDRLAKEDQQLVARAYKEGRARYVLMTERVFEATRPFGSNARWKP